MYMQCINQTQTCKFFIVPGNDTVLLGMSNIEVLNILSVLCNMIDMPQRRREINVQTTGEKS